MYRGGSCCVAASSRGNAIGGAAGAGAKQPGPAGGNAGAVGDPREPIYLNSEAPKHRSKPRKRSKFRKRKLTDEERKQRRKENEAELKYTSEQARASRDRRGSVVLLDGYNVIHASADLARLAKVDLRGARGLLNGLAESYGAVHDCRVFIVYDAMFANVPEDLPCTQSIGRFATEVFSPFCEADTLISEQAQHMKRRGAEMVQSSCYHLFVMVVSNDRYVQGESLDPDFVIFGKNVTSWLGEADQAVKDLKARVRAQDAASASRPSWPLRAPLNLGSGGSSSDEDEGEEEEDEEEEEGADNDLLPSSEDFRALLEDIMRDAVRRSSRSSTRAQYSSLGTLLDEDLSGCGGDGCDWEGAEWQEEGGSVHEAWEGADYSAGSEDEEVGVRSVHASGGGGGGGEAGAAGGGGAKAGVVGQDGVQPHGPPANVPPLKPQQQQQQQQQLLQPGGEQGPEAQQCPVVNHRQQQQQPQARGAPPPATSSASGTAPGPPGPPPGSALSAVLGSDFKARLRGIKQRAQQLGGGGPRGL